MDIRKARRQFRVVPKNQYFRLVHIPSGDYIQRHLSDFLTRKDALACRDRVIAAALNWDWSDPLFMQEIGRPEDLNVWRAIYA